MIQSLTTSRFNPTSLRIAHATCSDPESRDGVWAYVLCDFADFQLKYAPRAWKQERLVWTTVVQLNLIKNVNNIVDVLNHEMAIQTATRVDSIAGGSLSLMDDHFTEKHKILRLRLAPLRGVQTDLERKLGSGAFEDQGQLNNNGRGQIQSSSSESSPTDFDEDDPQSRRLPKEFYIRSNNSWKDRLKNGLRNAGRPYSIGSITGPIEKEPSPPGRGKACADLEEIAGVIAGCREDIKALWEDELVQKVLSKRKYRVDESSGLCVTRLYNRFRTKH